MTRNGKSYSDNGAKVIGPNANPNTHKLNPNVPTSPETPKSLANFLAAGEKPDAVKLTVRSMSVMTITIDHFRHVGQFRGFVGSPGGKVTSSTSVPSARWTTWRGATLGCAVLPGAMLPDVGSDDMMAARTSGEEQCSLKLEIFLGPFRLGQNTSTCIGADH